jgi:uncharacterized protein (TIGR03437 family)
MVNVCPTGIYSRALAAIGLVALIWSLPASAQYRRKYTPFIPNRYTLVLTDPPVADRFASRAALATSQADSYRKQIEAVQAQVKRSLTARNYRVLGSVSVLENAIFVAAPAGSFADLASISGVKSVEPSRRMKILLNRATALANAPSAWAVVGGQSNAGAGVKIGIIDTGIDQTHPALEDSTLSMPAGFPKGTASFTTNKVIVARSYVSMLSDVSPTDSLPDDITPRDRIGHGTLVAIAAAGESVATPAVSTSGSPMTISGMAPKAWLGNYKVAGSPGVEEFASDQTLIKAVEDAVADGMDVISCSIGAPAYSNYAADPVAAAFENATKMAVVVAAAGDGDPNSSYNGSQSPAFNTISSPSNAPDVVSVGATLNSHVMQPTVSVNAADAPSSLQSISALAGDSYFVPSNFGANQRPLIDVATIGGGNNGQACTALPANSMTGSYALIQQGPCGFDTPAANAQNAGAIGFIYYASSSTSLTYPEEIGEHGPTVMISNSDGVALKSYIDAHPGALVTVDLNGREQDLTDWNSRFGLPQGLNVAANQLASYSSLGPTPDGMLKPDLVAVGGFDAAVGPDPTDPFVPAPSGMYGGTQNYDPNQAFDVNLFSVNRYAAGEGSSFSTPLVAGAAALIKQSNPKLTPAQIRSLLINYAGQNVTTDDLGDPTDVEWIGAGSLDANAAIHGPVAATPATLSFGVLNGAKLPINQTITVTNVSSAAVSMNASVSCCSINASLGKPSFTVAVSPSSVSLTPGASATLTVTLSGTEPAAGEYSGYIALQSSSATMHIPFMALEASGVARQALSFGGGEGTPGADLGPASVQLTDAYGISVSGAAVKFSTSPQGSVTLESVAGKPACTPSSSATSVSCPSDQFGNAYVEVIAGKDISQSAVEFKFGGKTVGFFYNVQAAPAVAAGGVSDSAAGKTTVAPGSYVSIYGTGLSDFTDVNGLTTNALAANGAYSVLPLQLDDVSVTFDVPAAGISVPAGVVYVSPTQVNVQAPWELQGQSSAQMKVVLNGDLFGNVVTVPIANYQPAFFTYGSNVADALDLNYNLIGAGNPAKRGSSIAMFANGLGPVTNQPASGNPASATNLSNTTTAVTVSFGGQTAPAAFAGLAPGFPGLYQINVTVPPGVTPGSAVPVTITVGGVTSPQATLPIQ